MTTVWPPLDVTPKRLDGIHRGPHVHDRYYWWGGKCSKCGVSSPKLKAAMQVNAQTNGFNLMEYYKEGDGNGRNT